MSGSDYERELKDILTKKGWLVFRSAGSFVCDLIALKPDKHMLIEVKSTKDDRYYTTLTKETKAQFDMLNNLAKEGFNVWYYVRWKNVNKWSKYQLPIKTIDEYPVFRRKENDS